tara:strand:- start:21692 stop:22132 length:441 start_codon:yes stop_codon:yes gene_type:complete
MLLISHRGNINGRKPLEENQPAYIVSTLDAGYEVEIDVWREQDKWYLGHDKPEYLVEGSFLKTDRLWCHAKNLAALELLLDLGVNCFWHQNDDFTLTTKGYIWAFPGRPLCAKSICVLPELTSPTSLSYQPALCAGICSDFIERYK